MCGNLLRRLAPPFRFVVTGLADLVINGLITGLAYLVVIGLVTTSLADLVVTDFGTGFGTDFGTGFGNGFGTGFGTGFADFGTAKGNGNGKGNAADCNIDTIGSDFCLENIK